MLETVHSINGRGLGTTHLLKTFSFGEEGARPHVYIQGGLHADEGPGMLVATLLHQNLLALEHAGQITGRITIVPVANPIGLSQFGLGQQEGRFDIYDGRNFNRHYPDLTLGAVGRVECEIGDSPCENATAIRRALRAEIDDWAAETPADELRKRLLQISVEADYVLDLHCDGEAEVHLYTQPAFVRSFEKLSSFLGARAVLVADVSGDGPFDEAVSSPWVALRKLYGEDAIPIGCAATTVELRGRSDVNVDLAKKDAHSILQFLVSLNALSGGGLDVPPALCEPTPLAGSEALIAPTAGLLSYRASLGQYVNEGEIVADVINPFDGGVCEVRATTSGIFYARADSRIAEVGKRLGKIAGKNAFRTGLLLSP